MRRLVLILFLTLGICCHFHSRSQKVNAFRTGSIRCSKLSSLSECSCGATSATPFPAPAAPKSSILQRQLVVHREPKGSSECCHRGSQLDAACQKSGRKLRKGSAQTLQSDPVLQRKEHLFLKSRTTLAAEDQASTTCENIKRKLTLDNFSPGEISGKRVLLRADLNVPLRRNEERPAADPVIENDARIRASLPTLRYLLDSNGKVILCSHLGRPRAGEDASFYSMKPVAQRLQELLNSKVLMAPAVTGEAVLRLSHQLKDGEVLMLENVRFEEGETKNDESLSKALASLADFYVNDAFGSVHRAHSSTAGVTKFLQPAVAGFLLQKELNYLSQAVENPERPFAAIIGGAKISSKIHCLHNLLKKVDKLIIGGAMAFTFLKARGLTVGASLVEDQQIQAAQNIEKSARERGVELILPLDVIVADRCSADAVTKAVSVDSIPETMIGLDNGPETTARIVHAIQDCKTVLWNGPMGMSEYPPFASGTEKVALALAEITKSRGSTTIVGGGDSVAAIEKLKLSDQLSHISTGGGASLELLEGKLLPGIQALTEAERFKFYSA